MSNFGNIKKASINSLDKASLLLSNILTGKNSTADLFNIEDAINKSIKDLNNNIDEDEGTAELEENYINSFSIIQQTIKSTLDLVASIKEMANASAPNVSFLSAKKDTEDYPNLPYIELWGQYNNKPEPNIAYLYNTNGEISYRGEEGRFKIEFAVKIKIGEEYFYITKPTYYDDESKIKKDTVYLALTGVTVIDGNNNTISPSDYYFDSLDAYVDIIKASDGKTLLAKVNFCFNYPSTDISGSYPSNFFYIKKALGTDLFEEDMSFTLRVVDNRNMEN